MRELGALRRSCVKASFALLAVYASDTFACNVAPPLVQRQGESNETWEARRDAAEAELRLTLEQVELRKQARLWDEADMVFVGLISAIKVDGTIYRDSDMRAVIAKSARTRPPRPPKPFKPIDFFKGGEAYIDSTQLLKGVETFKSRWHWVGGQTSCGDTTDGQLSHAWPNRKMVIFAQWQSAYRLAHGKSIESKRLELYGLEFDQALDKRLKAVLEAGGHVSRSEH